ncbi:MAG TPA: cytochrome c [Bryobacteraceae bacterium]|nr:cytochrome c [Bryobacteraceae bacterium]
MKWAVLIFAACFTAQAHDIITTPITFDREIARIVYAHCASCHHDGGAAFSLMTYKAARPWAEDIKEEALARQMPPWGAVSGFGDFRNDKALTPEDMELIVSWVDGGVPEGDPKTLPPAPKFDNLYSAKPPAGQIVIHGDFKLPRALTLDGLWPEKMPGPISGKDSIQITATRPDGSIQPLLWLYEFKPEFAHAFLFREPVRLPAGTVIRGVPAGGSLALLKPGAVR